jgi:hypothetical protein
MSPDYFQNQVKCEEDLCAESSFPCYGKCIMSPPEIQLYDSKNKKLYFSVALDIGHNVPHAVFVANLNDRKVTFLFETDGSGLMGFALSPSGSWLAFLNGCHFSACESWMDLQVFNMREKKMWEKRPGKSTDENESLKDIVSYDSITWLSDTKLLLKGSWWKCRDGEESKGGEVKFKISLK